MFFVEADGWIDGQAIIGGVLVPKEDHCGKRKGSQMNPVYTLPCLIVKIHFNAYSYHLVLCLSSGLFFPGFLTTVYEALLWHIRAKCTALPLLLELVVVIQYRVKSKCKLWNSSLCSLVEFDSTSSTLGLGTSSALLTHARAIYSSHRMVDQVAQPSYLLTYSMEQSPSWEANRVCS